MYRYSERLSWTASLNAISKAVAAQPSPPIDLTGSNPTELKDYPHHEIAAALAGCRDFTYNPNPFGVLEARTSISDFYRELGFAGIRPERLALTASTSEAYALLFKLLCDPGDEILVPTPSYPLFDYLAAAENIRTIPYRLAYDGAWYIDLDHLRSQISPKTRAIVIVNPNNPTGSFLKFSECELLFEISAAHRLPIISDEVFMPFELTAGSPRVKTLASFPQFLSFSLNGLSKAAAMPQMKLAWIAINGPEHDAAEARERLELLLDTYLSVNTPVQLALSNLFAIGTGLRAQLLTRIRANLRTLHHLLPTSPVHGLHTEGGWSAILQLPAVQSDEQWVLQLLREQEVLLQPGFFFDLPRPACLVASLITEPDRFAEGLRRVLASFGNFPLEHESQTRPK